MSETVNPKLEFGEQLLKDTLWDGAVEAALTALHGAAAWTNVWPLRPIIRGTVHLVSDAIFKNLKLVVDLQAIRIMNAEHQKAFTQSVVVLASIAQNHGIESKEFLDAKETAKAELSRFAHFNG